MIQGVTEGHFEEVTFKLRNKNVNNGYLFLLLGHLEVFLRNKTGFWMILRS